MTYDAPTTYLNLAIKTTVIFFTPLNHETLDNLGNINFLIDNMRCCIKNSKPIKKYNYPDTLTSFSSEYEVNIYKLSSELIFFAAILIYRLYNLFMIQESPLDVKMVVRDDFL